jgi:hypothetical protein
VRVTQLCLRVANPLHHQHLHRHQTPELTHIDAGRARNRDFLT